MGSLMTLESYRETPGSAHRPVKVPPDTGTPGRFYWGPVGAGARPYHLGQPRESYRETPGVPRLPVVVPPDTGTPGSFYWGPVGAGARPYYSEQLSVTHPSARYVSAPSRLYHISDENKDTTEAEDADRDTRMMRYAKAKGHLHESMAPSPAEHYDRAWGGGLRRMVVAGVGPRREDEHYYAPRYVPVGYARYDPPTIDPLQYEYYRISGWRVAVPRDLPGPDVRRLLLRIYHYGPQSAGYVRIGDSLVPAILEYQERMTLNNVATGHDAYDKDALDY